MRGKWLLLAASAVLVAVAAGAIVAWRRDHAARQPQAQTAPAPPAAPSGEIALSGRIRAQHVEYVDAGVSGSVEQFFADIGQEVFEGQLLARISNQGLETARETAQRAADTAQDKINQIEAAIISARLESSRARADAIRARAEFDRHDKIYRRQRMLFAEGATPRLTYEKSEREFNDAKTEFDSLDQLAKQAEERSAQLLKDLEAAKRSFDDKSSQLEGVKDDLRAGEVRSPVTGTVVSRKGVTGDTIEAGSESARLFGIATDLAALEVVLEPEPPVLQALKAGVPALVILADVPEPLNGSVKAVQGNEAVVEFVSPNPLVKPGMTAQVRLRLG
jgi:multidrug efflux pump subunit AcrA (membrane-fusion protein)